MAAKILVVDDEIDLQELMKRKFRREIRHGEFDFDFACDGVEALEKVKNGTGYDLVVSDINMPRMDGLTLLEHLNEFEDHLRTIIISAYGDMENIRSAMNRGAFDFVTKPIDFHDLLITIKKTLDQIYVIKEALDQRMAAERARANLARYFAPSMVDVLAARDKPFGPPRQQDVGVLFIDIRGFTTISETMSPAATMELLRGFHSRVEAVVFEHTGTLEKFIGDAVLATFGTPDTGPQDATETLTCARELLSVIEQWNQVRATTGERPIGVGIGVHYGPAVLGDIGSERSMDFTIIGDTVNTTNRLERLTRTLDTDLVVSQALVDKVRDESGGEKPLILSNFWEAGDQEVKGRSGRIPVLALRRLRAA